MSSSPQERASSVDRVVIRTVAHALLGLELRDDEACRLEGALAGLRQLVKEIEAVPLPYLAEPFIAPHDECLDGRVE